MRILTSILLLTFIALTACKSDVKNEPSEIAKKLMAEGLDTLTRLPKQTENPWKNNACALLTDEEFSQVFGVANPSKDVNTRTLPDQSFCLRTWMKPDWKERESNNDKPNAVYKEFKNTLVIKVVNYGLANHSANEIEMVRATDSTSYQQTPGLADAAYWNAKTRTMSIQKGAFNLHITLDYADDAQENLAKAKEVAGIILKKVDL